jgi:hypothetical protein
MKNYSVVLLNLMMGACLFLYGHGTVAETDVGKNRASVSAKQDQAENNKSSGQKANAPAVDTDNADQAFELQKPLDLSIPFEVIDSTGQKSEKNAAAQNLFTARKQRTLQLNGGAVMTQEPEGEKQQSVDGAGIIFSLKP